MSMNVGDLVASVGIEDKGVDKTLKKNEERFKEFGNKIKDYAKVAGLAIVAGIGYGLKGAIEKASDLSETQSKVQQIFGDSADTVLKFAATADRALGQSKQQALDAASTFAIFGKGAGLSGQKLVDFSLKLNALASDLSSFYNTSPQQAIEAIGAALRGEAEPIRAFGVLLDDASLRNQAFAMGLTKTTKNVLTPQQRVLAAQALIFKQTKVAQGDFARTSGGLANQSRILHARLDNLQADVGSKLLPYTLKVVTAFGKLLDWVTKNKTAIKEWGEALAPIAAVVLAVVAAYKAWIVVQGILNVLMDANPVGLVIMAIVALAVAIVIAWKRSETFRKIVKATWSGIKTAVSATVNWITGTAWPALRTTWNAIAGAALWLWHNIFEPFGKGVMIAVSFVVRIFTSLYNLIAFFVGPPIKAMIFLIALGVKGLGAAIGWLWKMSQPALRALGAGFQNAWRVARPVLAWLGKQITWFAGVAKSVFGKVGGFLAEAFQVGVKLAKASLNVLISVLNSALDNVNFLIRGANKIPGVDFPTIPLIPHLARGGSVSPVAGGRPVIMGDAGEVEYGIPQSRLLRLLRLAGVVGRGGQGGGGTITLIIKHPDGRTERKRARVQGGDYGTVYVGGSPGLAVA